MVDWLKGFQSPTAGGKVNAGFSANAGGGVNKVASSPFGLNRHDTCAFKDTFKFADNPILPQGMRQLGIG